MSIRFRWRHVSGADVHLNGWENQHRHCKCPVTRHPHAHEVVFADAVVNMDIPRPLFAYR